MKFYTADTESNGFRRCWHELTQISVIRHDDRNQINKYIKIKHPERTNPQSLSATGRTWADLKKGISAEEAVEAIHNFIIADGLTPEHRVFVCHSVAFDRPRLQDLWIDCKKEFPVLCWLDTKEYAKKYMQQRLGIPKPVVKLASCIEQLEIKMRPGKLHDAILDTQLAYLVFDHISKQGFDHLPFVKRLPTESLPEPDDDE